jgi:hypothetical protein
VLPESPAPLLGLSLRCDRRAPRLARQALSHALDSTPVLDDARLIASELVSHAVLYSGCAADAIMRVMARLDDGFLIISVHVPGAFTGSESRRHQEDTEVGGFALRVVTHVAERWGAERPDAHHVWAALPVGVA